MNVVNAFLLASAVAYFWCVLIPKRISLSISNIVLEKISYLILGLLIIANMMLNIQLLWLVMGIIWVLASLYSYLGIQKWNVDYRSYGLAGVAMWAWDLMIALSCFINYGGM